MNMKSITLRMVTVLAVATVPLGLVGAAHAADSPQVKVSAVAADATKSGDAVVGTLVQDVRDLLGTGLTGKPKGDSAWSRTWRTASWARPARRRRRAPAQSSRPRTQRRGLKS